MHPRTEGGLSRGRMPLAELVCLSRSADDEMHFASLQRRYDQNTSVVFSVALFCHERDNLDLFSYKSFFFFSFNYQPVKSVVSQRLIMKATVTG